MRGVKALFTSPRSRVCSAPSVTSIEGGIASSSEPDTERNAACIAFEKRASSRSVACTSS